ncbi:MAG: hypothetical protein AAGH57_12420 [Pseudomonadota bacterium]
MAPAPVLSSLPSLSRSPASWQLILADLALILFLMTAAALTGGEKPDGAPVSDRAQPDPLPPGAVAPAQALYRAGPGLPTLAEWLLQQPRDPRAALTIVAQHPETETAGGRVNEEAERAWADARAMAATASAMGIRSRVIIRSGASYDVHASLAYDQPGG